jgi:predicted nucleotidyltransferase
VTAPTGLDGALAAVSSVAPRFAVVGGLAVSVRTTPRFTRDLDVAVAVADDVEAEAMVLALRNAGWTVGAVVEQSSRERLATVRFTGPGPERFELDLLFASSGIEAEIVEGATVEAIAPSVAVPVACAAHLVALKLLAEEESRPHDGNDLLALAAVMTEAEWARAERAVGLIMDRGYHRQRALDEALDDLRARTGRARGD